jgi:hypothetical protein
MISDIQKRFKLLSEYDNSRTLTENMDVISEQLVGTAAKMLGKNVDSLLPAAGQAAGQLWDDVFNTVGKQLRTMGNKPISSTDDMIKALRSTGKNSLNLASIGKIRMNLLKSPTLDVAKKAQMIDDYVSKPEVLKNWKGSNKTINQISDDLAQKFPGPQLKSTRDAMAKKIKSNLRGGGKKTPPPNQNNLNQGKGFLDKYPALRKYNWEQLKSWGKKAGIGIGVIAAIWWIMSDGEAPPDPIIDNGGGGGGQQNFPNEGQQYPECTGGVYKKGCWSLKVKEVQSCLGVSPSYGNFGPKTETALKTKFPDKEFYLQFTDADIPTICQKTPEPPTPEPPKPPTPEPPKPEDEDLGNYSPDDFQ